MNFTAPSTLNNGAKKLLLAMLIPLFLLFTAFGAHAQTMNEVSFTNAKMKFHENGTVDMRMEMKLLGEDFKEFGPMPKIACDQLLGQDPEDGLHIEDRSADGNVHCIATATNQPLDKLNQASQDFSLEDGVYTIEIPSMDSPTVPGADPGINMSMEFEFAGQVTEASVGQIVDGNRVIISSADQLNQGGIIKANAAPTMNNFLLWALIGLGVLALVGLILWLVLRNKKKSKQPHHPAGPNAGPGYGGHQSGPHQQGQPHSGNQYGASQQGWQPNPQQQQPPRHQAPGQYAPGQPTAGQWGDPQGQQHSGQPQQGHPQQPQHGQPHQGQPHHGRPQQGQPWQPNPQQPPQGQPWQQGQPYPGQNPQQGGYGGVQGQQWQPRPGQQPYPPQGQPPQQWQQPHPQQRPQNGNTPPQHGQGQPKPDNDQ
ncbi:hypothetical protein [Micrococcoides hystricis]|uniref:Uncharacterized protein n=1 Tax=Micrococcoides hystricis TaxID=1572761 RepID=A0ABV6PBK4_9MICC